MECLLRVTVVVSKGRKHDKIDITLTSVYVHTVLYHRARMSARSRTNKHAPAHIDQARVSPRTICIVYTICKLIMSSRTSVQDHNSSLSASSAATFTCACDGGGLNSNSSWSCALRPVMPITIRGLCLLVARLLAPAH